MSKAAYELFPGVYANEEQCQAIDAVQAYLSRRTKPNEYFTLIGKAGTGKTTVLRKALETAKGAVIVGALTHKAKDVVQRSIGNKRYRYYSLASMLGMQLDLETGKFTADYSSRNEPPIAIANVIVIDECSMINEEALDLIMEHKLSNAKVIFVGDSNQLAPIRESGSSFEGMISPVFKNEHQIQLVQSMRQGEQSTILPYADFYWNNARSENPVLDPVPEKARKNSKNVKFITQDSFLSKTLKQFKQIPKTRNADIIRLVCYRNATRARFNQFIRHEIFDNPDTYEVNDLLVLFDGYSASSLTSGETIKLENSQELFVTSVARQARVVGKDKVFHIFYLGVEFMFKGNLQTAYIEVLDPLEKSDFDAYVTELFTIANNIPKSKAMDRKMAYITAYSTRNKFAKAEYGYAIGVHKSQGSTYDEVVVYESDIMNISMNSEQEKSQAMYVAITRARDKCFILN